MPQNPKDQQVNNDLDQSAVPCSSSVENRRLSQIVGGALGEIYRYKNRNLIVVLIFAIIGACIAFALPKVYRSSSMLLLTTPSKSPDLSALAGGLDGGSLSSILSGGGYGNRSAVRELMSLLETRELALSAVDTFRLDTLWDLKRVDWEKLQKRWISDFEYLEDENGAIFLSFRATDSSLTRRIVLWVGVYAEKHFQRLKQTQLEMELAFIRERTRERKMLFEAAEDSLLAYQQKHKMFAPEEQIRFLSSALMEKEKNLDELDQKIKITTMEAGLESQPVKYLSTLRQNIDKSITQMLDSSRPTTAISKSLPLSLQKALVFNRLHRNVLIQGKIYGYLLQQQEQISIEKQKTIPALLLIDPPRSPTQRVAPPRIAIMTFFVFLGFISSVGYLVFRSDIEDFRQAFLSKIREIV